MAATMDVLTHLDGKKANELQNWLVHKLSEAPSSPVEGQIYYDTATHHLMVRGAASWIQADGLAILGGAGLVRTGETIDVGAGTGITVNANDVAVDTSVIATKAYVDATAQGLDIKASVRVATTANVTISTALNEGDTLDGVSLVNGDRVLVKDQTTKKENGIYVVGAVPARATDADGAGELTGGTFVFVEAGTANADSGWVITTDGAITIGTTEIVWVQFSGAGQITAGSGIGKTGNELTVGAGEGLTAEADGLKINTAVVPRLAVTNTFTSSQIIKPAGDSALTVATGSKQGTLIQESAADKLWLMAVTGELYLYSFTKVINCEESKLAKLANPTAAQDAATKAYVDAYSGSIGNGALTEITVEHNLGSEDVTPTFRYAGGTKGRVEVYWEVVDANKIKAYFNTAPASNAIRVHVSR